VVVWEILHQKLTYPIPLIWNTPQTSGLAFDQIISAVLKVDMSFSLKLMMRFGCRGDVAMSRCFSYHCSHHGFFTSKNPSISLRFAGR
jgi:hypothetical protein